VEEKLAVAMKEAEGLGPASEMERAWRENLQSSIDSKIRDLEFYQGKGKEYAADAILEELNNEVAASKGRIEKVESLLRRWWMLLEFNNRELLE
jgi:hypothetical protein